jgi:hypothetical protein
LPDGLEFIGERAFEYCECLRELYIPESVTELSKSTIVDDCDSFSYIYYGGNEAQWNAIDFYDKLTNNLYIEICFNIKYFTETVRIMYDVETTTASVYPIYELSGKQLCFAVYNNGVIENVQTVLCEGETWEYFETDAAHTEIKILYWNSLDDLSPEIPTEKISTSDWSE